MIADASTPERAAAIGELATDLVEVARLVHPGKLRELVKQYTDAMDGDGGASGDEKHYELNRAHLSKTFAGRGQFDVSFDPEAYEIAATALDAKMAELRIPGDPRDASQRRYEAVVEIFRQFLGNADDGEAPTARSSRT